MSRRFLPAPSWPRRAAVALLQADRETPPRSDDEIAAEVARNYRWNFTVNLLDGAFFWFGITFVSSSTIAPLFISKLTDSPLPIGLVAAIAQSAWFLPQVFTANVVERLPHKKPVVINAGFFLERLPMWVIVLAALVAGTSPLLALLLFFAGYAWHGLGAGIIATAWQDLIARCFPVNRRGRFFGLANFLGAGMGVAGSAFSTWILDAAPFPTSFVYIFFLAAASLVVSWAFLALTREPVQPISAPRQSNRQFLTGLPRIVRDDHNFRRFLLARSLLAVGGMGTGFVTVAAVARWQVPDSTVGLYTGAYLIGQTAANLAFGLLADRFGHKLSLELGALASTLAFVLAWLALAPGWMFVVFVLLGVNLGAVLVSGILITLEFSEPQRRPTYVGLANTAVGLVSIVAPLLGALLAGIDYSWVFGLSVLVNLAALIAMRWRVREPRGALAMQG